MFLLDSDCAQRTSGWMHEINVYKWTETGVKTSDWMEILIRSMHIFGMGLYSIM